MAANAVSVTLGGAIFQILLLDLVFSIDSILTAVGMTDHLPIMIIAVIVAVAVMLVAATPLANFIDKNPTIVMLALGFLLMIGMTLIADGFGVHVPKGYIYAAMALLGAGRGPQHACAHPPLERNQGRSRYGTRLRKSGSEFATRQ